MQVFEDNSAKETTELAAEPNHVSTFLRVSEKLFELLKGIPDFERTPSRPWTTVIITV
jgi:hypothetical protein